MTQSGLDHTLMALADPTRRVILQQIAEGDARKGSRSALPHLAQLGFQAHSHF